jgi:hypothetical protein
MALAMETSEGQRCNEAICSATLPMKGLSQEQHLLERVRMKAGEEELSLRCKLPSSDLPPPRSELRFKLVHPG